MDYRLPENAEGSIVGCLLVCPHTKAAVAEIITEADFSSPVFGAMFSAAIDMDEPDSALFHELVRKKGYTVPDGFFSALCDIAVSEYNIELYAKLLRENAQRRRLQELSEHISQSVRDRAEPGEIIADACTRLQEIEPGSITSDIADGKDAWKAFSEHRGLVESGKGAVPTGFEPLDAILGGGMLRSGLYILAARPGMGKTTAALQFADSIARQTGPILFVSLEMSPEQIEGKRLARESGVASDKVLLGKLVGNEYRSVIEAGKRIRPLPLYISRCPTANVAKIRLMAKRIENLKCVVVDYLGKISPSENRKSSIYESITAISGDLKTLAVELGVPVLCLAQLNRENTSRTDKRPQLSDLRDSGAIEQDADGVIMLHRSDYYEMSDKPLEPWESVELEIIVRKNRHGRIGNCKAAFFPATGRIVGSK